MINLGIDVSSLLREIQQQVDFIIKVIKNSRIEILNGSHTLDIKRYNHKRYSE